MKIAILHYTSTPVIGGVEVVILAHARLLTANGHEVTIISGRGSKDGLPDHVDYVQIPLMDSQHPDVIKANSSLEQGIVPEGFHKISELLTNELHPHLKSFDCVIVHNIFTKHFNLPLTEALLRLQDQNEVSKYIAWCHDISWTSSHSIEKMHPGYPWDLIKIPRDRIIYVAVSEHRKDELVNLFKDPPVDVRVIYNGIDPYRILGISSEIKNLIDGFNLWQASPLILMPVRITQAKNIEFAMKITAKIRESNHNPQLIVTGPPDPHDPDSYQYFKELDSIRKQLNLEKHVTFLFENTSDPQAPFLLSVNQVFELLRIADLVLMPSHREGFGLPILEAGLVGIPVASTSIPVAEEIGKNNLLVIPDQGDPGPIADQMLRWLENIPTYRLKNRIKHELTWQAIYETLISPLLKENSSFRS